MRKYKLILIAIQVLASTLLIIGEAKPNQNIKTDNNVKIGQEEGEETSDYPDLLNLALQLYR